MKSDFEFRSETYRHCSEFITHTNIAQVRMDKVPTCIMVLTDQQKKFFIENGYVLLREAIPKPQVIAARKKADEAYAEKRYKDHDTHKGIVPGFEESLGKTQEIGHMLKNSVLLEACEDLLGKGNVRYGNKAQVAFRPTEHDFREKGMGIKELMPNHRWHVDGGDGKYRETGTPFTLLVGVVLSPGQMCDENRGQLHVWPGSHIQLHELLKQRILNGEVNGRNMFGVGPGVKPDVGAPIRLRMRPGDAVFAHQRLAHSGGINLHNNMRKNLYFRVKHLHHDELLEETWKGSVWTEYEGLHKLTGLSNGSNA